MRGERMLVQGQGALQVNLRRFGFALIAAEQSEQQPRAEMIALFVERATQENGCVERFPEIEIVFADGETEFSVALVERERRFEHPQSPSCAPFADEQN